MPNVTVAFDEGVGGWTSEFTYLPDSGLSLNNKFFTFHNGEMYQHNNPDLARNNFYGIQGETMIQFVFNQNPTTVKNFKTLGFEGVGDWTADLETNLEEGQITRFLVKEGKRYAWIEGDSQKFENIDFASNAVQGIGTVVDRTGVAGEGTMIFSSLPPFISAQNDGGSDGDALYAFEQTAPGVFAETPRLIGVVESISGNTITFNTEGVPGIIDGQTISQDDFHVPVQGDFVIYVKDNQQEKSGIIGYYTLVTMSTDSTEKAEIFSVNSNSFITTV